MKVVVDRTKCGGTEICECLAVHVCPTEALGIVD
jgi:hypothetical protein